MILVLGSAGCVHPISQSMTGLWFIEHDLPIPILSHGYRRHTEDMGRAWQQVWNTTVPSSCANSYHNLSDIKGTGLPKR